MFPWFTVAKYGIPFIVGGLIFGGVAWKIQEWRYGGDRVKLEACVSANKETLITVEQLKKDAEKFNKTCQERLAAKDAIIRGFQEIDNTGGYDATTGNNPLRDSLNGMYRNR